MYRGRLIAHRRSGFLCLDRREILSDKTLFRGLAIVLLGSVVLAPLAFGQEAAERKVKSRVEPTYPELAKSMHLTGAVKIQVTITPAGEVKSTKVIGGNPVFVESALTVIKKWRFEPGKEETTQLVTFNFHM
jgi:TonB family protein